MCTDRSSSHHGGRVFTPPGAGTPQEQAQPPGAGTPHGSRYPQEQAPLGAGTPHGSRHCPWEQAPPGSRHPPCQIPSTSPLGVGLDQILLNFPLGLGAWTRSPSTSPLGVGLESCKECWDTTTPRRPAARHAGIPPAMHAGIAPPLFGQNSWHILLKILPCPQTSFAGGN